MAKQPSSLHLPNFNQSQSSSSAPTTAITPPLPRAKRPSFSSHRNDSNATRALDLLSDVEAAVTSWHQSLRQTLREIQALYRSGPIVEGWLEAVPSSSPQTAAHATAEARLLRHGDPMQLAAYVDTLAQQPPSPHPGPTQYRLCHLDADGRLHCQICPPDQLGVVSQAIARHQKLRQLVNHKCYLEARLKRAADALETTRRTLGLPSQ